MSKTIILQKNDIHCTLCTYLYCHGWMAYSAAQLGYKSYFHWPKGLSVKSYEDDVKFKEQPNQFLWYFIQPEVENLPTENYETLVWESFKDPIPVSLMASPLSVIKDYFKKNLIFNDYVNQRGQALVDKYGIDFTKTIGITWRGSDIYLDGRPRVPIETYYPFIDELLEKEPDLRIMATAEEETILDPLLARYPSAFKIEEFVSVPFQSKHNPERFSAMSGFERGLQPALMVWLFSKCAHYIKNRSSTGAVASWLSDGRIVNIFHPETLGFPANTSTVEINGQQYTTDNKLIL